LGFALKNIKFMPIENRLLGQTTQLENMRTLHSGKLKYWQLLLLTILFSAFFQACASTPPRITKKSKPTYEQTHSNHPEKERTSTLLEKATTLFTGEPPAPPLLPYQKDLKAAQHRYDLQKYPEAEFFLKKALIKIPDEPSALKLLPWTYFYQQKYGKALLAFERGRTINPKNSDTLTGMGWCYLAMNNFKQALETFKLVEEDSPRGYDAHKGRAILFLKQKNPSRALPFLKKIYTGQEIQRLLAFWESEGETIFKSSYPVLPVAPDSASLLTLPVDAPRYRSMLRGFKKQKHESPELEKAWRYYRQRLYPRALKAFQDLPETVSTTLDAQNGLAWSYFKNKKIQKADRVFKRIAETYPNFIGIVNGVQESENLKLQKADHAQYYLDLNKLRMAESKYRALMEKYPKWAHSYAQMGRIALKLYNIEEARKFLHSALKLDPASKEGLLGMEEMEALLEPDLYKANQALKQEDFQKAASLFHDYIELHKTSTYRNFSLARAYNGLGWSQYHKGEFQYAIEKFKRSKKFKPFKTDSLRGIGLSNFHLRNYNEAITYLKAVKDKQPNELKGQYELDWSILRAWRSAHARRYFEKEMAIDPLRASLYMGMGWVQYKDRKPDLAVEFFLKAIALDPDSAVSEEFFNLLEGQRFGWQVYNRLGWAYYHKRNFNRSLEMFRISLKENPNKPGAYKGIGYNLFQLEKYTSAIKNLEQALRINPSSTPVMETLPNEETNASLKIRTTARTKLARAYYRSGDYLKAVRYYQKDLTFHPELADAHAGLGWAYLKLRRLTESRAAFTESLKLEPMKTASHKGLTEVKQLLATQNIHVKKPDFTEPTLSYPVDKTSPN
jgi:tetratricopeptide (TPR) repeat protein